MTTSLIVAANLTKSFTGVGRGAAPVPVLGGITLRVEPGELVAIVGPSGSGKSTLLYCLAGLETCSSGSVSLLGRDLSTLGRRALAALRRHHVGFVFQSFNLIPSLSARDNVALPARLARRSTGRQVIDDALAAVGLTDRAHHKPGELSGGQQQRVAIARIIAMTPDIVFADEPTGALDTATGTEILKLLRAAAVGSRSVVMVTHDVEAAALADRVLVLRDGLIHRELRHPTPEHVLDAIALAKTAV
jgi:putative ABC transport system ATP-binding protein